MGFPADHHWAQSQLVSTPWVKGCIIDGFLFPQECEDLLSQLEDKWHSVTSQYPEDYRNHDRALCFSKPLADALYTRFLPFLIAGDMNVRPIGFGRSGVWRPQRLNECIKFNRYYPSRDTFAAHRDGPWTPRAEEASIYTLIVYLSKAANPNSDVDACGRQGGYRQRRRGGKDNEQRKDALLKGGYTQFVKVLDNDRMRGAGWINTRSVCSVAPVQGRALFFDHRAWHRSSAVLEGEKVVLRTEVIFRREEGYRVVEEDHEYLDDPAYAAARQAYEDSQQAEVAGDKAKFTSTYNQVLNAQVQASDEMTESLQPKSGLTHAKEWMLVVQNLARKPPEHNGAALLALLSTLAASSRRARVLASEPDLWRSMYRSRWGCAQLAQERHEDDPRVDAAVRDWRNLYRQTLHVRNAFDPAVIAFDAASLRAKMCSDAQGDSQLVPEESCWGRWRPRAAYYDNGVAEVPTGIEFVDALHMNMPENHRFAVGWPGDRAIYGSISPQVDPLVGPDGQVLDWALMCVPVRLALGQHDPFVHPLIVVEPPGLPLKPLSDFRARVADASFQILRSPAVAFVSPFVAVLLARERSTGISVLLPSSRAAGDAPPECGYVGAVLRRNVVDVRPLPEAAESQASAVGDAVLQWAAQYDPDARHRLLEA